MFGVSLIKQMEFGPPVAVRIANRRVGLCLGLVRMSIIERLSVMSYHQWAPMRSFMNLLRVLCRIFVHRMQLGVLRVKWKTFANCENDEV